MRGEDLTAEILWQGYCLGLFPMTMPGGEVEWFKPSRRAVFPLTGIRVSRSLRRTIRRGVFEIRFDTSFPEVMRGCFRPSGNWLSEHFVRAYGEAFDEGWAHCCETWRNGRLVGGVYGLALGTNFSAESMFHRETDASKVALWALVERCRELGFTIFDAEMMNPHLASLGAEYLSQYLYVERLQTALQGSTPWSGRR